MALEFSSDLDLLGLDLSRKARNRLSAKDRAFHDWYRFVLSFPPHLVRYYLQQFQATGASVVLDPFAGTGTTLVEVQKLGLTALGIEANPMAHFACGVKLDWSLEPEQLQQATADILAAPAPAEPELPAAAADLLFKNAISPRPLTRVLTLLRQIDDAAPAALQAHYRLALARAAVMASNLRFAPEVGVSRKHKLDAPVVELWLAAVEAMVADLSSLETKPPQAGRVYHGDARQPRLPKASIDMVITSPPYPNEKDYTRATRLESVILGFLESRADLKLVKDDLVRSNSRNVYSRDDDDRWIQQYPEILELADTINQRRQQLGKTSGFSRLYARATTLYFGGMARHLANLRPLLRPGARLAYVVGEQASYLQVHIPTGRLLATIAQDLGYELSGIDLFRTRRASKTEVDLREEVVRLRWPG